MQAGNSGRGRGFVNSWERGQIAKLGTEGQLALWRGAEDSLSPERDRQLEGSLRLPDRPASWNSWGSCCGPRPSLCGLKAPAGLGDPGFPQACGPLPKDHLLSEAGGIL